MTREEKIEQQALACYETCSDEDIAKTKGFIEGAKWADKTMIEKACEWLEEENRMRMFELEMILGKNFINYFKKAMEE